MARKANVLSITACAGLSRRRYHDNDAAVAGAADVPVTLDIWPHMIHAWHLWPAKLEDGRRALDSAGAFINARL